MQLNLPPKVRSTLYIITAVGTPLVAYLLAKHVIGQLEVTLWSAEVAVTGGVAALHTPSSSAVDSPLPTPNASQDPLASAVPPVPSESAPSDAPAPSDAGPAPDPTPPRKTSSRT